MQTKHDYLTTWITGMIIGSNGPLVAPGTPNSQGEHCIRLA